MLDDPPIEIDDAMLARRMGQGDEDSFRLLLKNCGGRLKGVLNKRYREVLDASEIDQAFWDGAFNVWHHADRFDESEGTLEAWFLVIAIRAAVNIIRGEKRHRHQDLQYDPSYDPVSWGGGTTTTRSAQKSRLIHDLNEAIARLPRLQREIILADLAAEDGKADARRLAKRLGSTKNAVYAARSKALVSLQRSLSAEGDLQGMQGGQR